MQVCDRHENEHTYLKQLGGDPVLPIKKGKRCLLVRIAKAHHYRHQRIKLKIKFNLYFSDSYQQKIKKYVLWDFKL